MKTDLPSSETTAAYLSWRCPGVGPLPDAVHAAGEAHDAVGVVLGRPVGRGAAVRQGVVEGQGGVLVEPLQVAALGVAGGTPGGRRLASRGLHVRVCNGGGGG